MISAEVKLFFIKHNTLKMQWKRTLLMLYWVFKSLFFLVQSSKLSMQCNFSDHIVAFGRDSEWLSDISTAALLCSAKIAPAVSAFAF